MDFSFINDLCRPYYCENNGRPAIEPEIMFKMLFIGYLFGIRSKTRLVEDVKVNIKKPDDEDDENYFDDDTPTKTIKKSRTDPDSGFMHRDGKPHKAFFTLITEQ